jgi:hypothetical protein
VELPTRAEADPAFLPPRIEADSTRAVPRNYDKSTPGKQASSEPPVESSRPTVAKDLLIGTLYDTAAVSLLEECSGL